MSKILRTLTLVVFSLVLLSTTAVAYRNNLKKVTVEFNGKTSAYETSAVTVGEFIEKEKVGYVHGDFINLKLESELKDGASIIIKTSVPITLYVDGVPQHIKTCRETVSEVMYDLDHNLNYVLVSPSAQDKVTPDMEIVINSKIEKEIVKTIPIPFESQTKENDDLDEGKKNLLIKGIDGEKEAVYKEIFIGGEKTESVLVKETITIRPVHEVYEVGTKKYIQTTSSTLGERNYSKVFDMEATAYTQYDPGCTDRTATGDKVRVGIVAVDPRVIPLGTKLYVEGYGDAIALDTGGAIKGHRIDLVFNTVKEAKQFGRRPVKVYVLAD